MSVQDQTQKSHLDSLEERQTLKSREVSLGYPQIARHSQQLQYG